ncbi:chromate transporter [Fictibacillus barbaricus]|uniref:Chromate transporter n=1 Tax=Fictibacillus barbaricus TaxID=182136 RepID=A0ABU1TXP6_9BACL|nr:chromate transporter [Fictibacillus barbaricus]
MKQAKRNRHTLLEIFFTALRLGLTSFGGPIAHLGYFRDEYVQKRKWLDDRTYADLVALCQFLPGPASSQVGIGIGAMRGGLLGGFFAWLGFTMPSVIALILFAYFLKGTSYDLDGLIHALKIVAVAVVAQALVGMGKNLANTNSKAGLAVLAAAAVLLMPSAIAQLGVILIAAMIGYFLYRESSNDYNHEHSEPNVKRGRGWVWLVLFSGVLAILPFLRSQFFGIEIAMMDTFYRVGSLVFGGGHVVLPMLEREVVPSHWVSSSEFFAGYGAAQAVPGPLFTFAAYLGTMTAGISGGIIAVIAIFLPSFLLVYGALPYWNSFRNNVKFSAALTGVNAAVVGLLLAAFYDPLWTSTIKAPLDFVLSAIAFTALVIWKLPPWMIVAAAVIGGIITSFIS